MVDYDFQIREILSTANVKIKDIRPSVWAEENIIMPHPRPGALRYNETTPYTREIVDFFASDHPGRECAIMGAAQFGKTASVILPAIGWIIENDPGNIIMTVGHESLMKEAVDNIDAMLDSTGLRKLIRPIAQRAKATKTGDTDEMKQFPGGYLKLSSASNPKIWRQSSYRYGIIDDYDAVKNNTKIAGSTNELIGKRFTAYSKTKKILYVSSPELEESSNIYKAYLAGDQRKFLVPCPCCGVFIELAWSVEGKKTEKAGITWKIDDKDKVIPESIGYICQECGDFFTDQHKQDYVSRGYWQPTAEPSRPGFYSYYMNCLYSPHFMDDWEHYIYKFIDCHPQEGLRDEAKYQTFLNLNLGWPYKPPGETISASQLQKNVRNYSIGTVPEEKSIKDGNGNIVMLTCAIDMNGTVFNEQRGFDDDARLDYEVVAWSETGASYSVTHGSIGTFIPLEKSKKIKVDRKKWTYEFGRDNSVWPELDKILDSYYPTDNGREMPILFSALDTGHFTNAYAYPYIDYRASGIIGIKGDKEDSFVRANSNTKKFVPAAERKKIYIIKVGSYKDQLSQLMGLKWNESDGIDQPVGFMNFPHASEGKYEYLGYFQHYEAEEKVIKRDKAGMIESFIWQKKKSNDQNHFFDVRLYNLACRDIFVDIVCQRAKRPFLTWQTFSTWWLGMTG